MKNKPRPHRPATFPLTIGTPYGEVQLELEVCENCAEHFSFRVVSSAPALSTRAAEPFLYRLMNSMESIGSLLWMELPPVSVRRSIALGTYSNDELVLPALEVN
jgi:hypothetical protein